MATSRNRETVMAYLRTHGPVTDPAGHATAVLKAAVAESASPMAFTQLIAALARSGHVVREVRGKRTFAIAAAQEPATVEATGSTSDVQASAPGSDSSGRALSGVAARHHGRAPRASRTAAPTATETAMTSEALRDTTVAGTPAGALAAGPVDADEVAAALLAQVTKLLTDPNANQAAGWMRRRVSKLETQVTELEQALAKARAEARQLSEQRDELQERVDRAEQNLTVLSQRLDQPRPGHSRAQRRLGPAEQALLLQLQNRRQRPEHVG
ncbi:MAG: hypothetical protein M0Z82_06735 [Actinomycetota bacterium]|jgi:hypothetical protein|nr:hypothetical protein [Actinomycetota bacterium]